MADILIAGCGDVGTALGERLAPKHTVYGLRRNVVRLPPGIQPVAGDLTRPETLEKLPMVDYVFFTAAAGGFEESLYRRTYITGLHNLIQALAPQHHHLRRFFFTSSTGVYHQNDGSWVNEESPTLPASFSGKIMLEAETKVMLNDFPTTIVRLSGVYGPGRFRMLQQVLEGYAPPAIPPAYTNRIHRDDCAGLLAHLMGMGQIEDLYVATDMNSAPMNEVAEWMRTTMIRCGLTPAPPMGRSTSKRPRTSKRCSNRKLLETGYRFQYSSYREGYEGIVRQWARDILNGHA